MPRPSVLPLLVIVSALWAIHVFFLAHLAFTGDEVRYVAYGLGLFYGEGFHPSDANWLTMLGPLAARHPLQTSPAGHAGLLIHSVVYPVLGAPLIYLAGLDGARWLSFAVGAAGLAVLFACLRRRFAPEAGLAGVLAVALACPLIFFIGLFFSEILLFTANALVVAFFLDEKHRNPKYLLPAGLCLCLLPFLHVKLSLEAAAAFLILLASARRYGASRARLLSLLAAAGGLFGLYLLYNYTLFGAPIGGGNPAFPTSPRLIADRLIVNFFDMRHGLLPNAPHLLFGLIGLLWAAKDRDSRVRPLLPLFAAYLFTILWANGSEAYAARNWTAAMPFVAVGFAKWYEDSGRLNQLLAVPFLLLSLGLLCILLQHPDAFLDSRNYSVPYDLLFARVPWFNLGYLLPYDFLDHEGAQPYAAWGLGLAAAGVVGLYVAGQLLANRPAGTGQRGRMAAGAAAQIAALAVILVFSLVERVDVGAAIVHEPGHSYLVTTPQTPGSLAFVRVENPRAMVKPYGFFLIALEDGGTLRAHLMTRASAVVPLPPFTRADAVLISETMANPAQHWLDTATGAALYRRLIPLPGLDASPAATQPTSPRSSQ
ncbi:hypothetical protein [Desulfovibrio sp. TomC]|uniref:hypothetical protein n=1 Tax=Desulfovibrio sp. TomC TaxID=1562888 RepID=UPI0012E13C52|nr:hypothetical protein [Desulfovibrio sp. TomC]